VGKALRPLPAAKALHDGRAQENEAMKFMLLIYQPTPFDPKAYSPEERKTIGAEYAALSTTKNVTPGLPLGLPADAVTVRVSEGETVTSHGPYVDVAGAVGGYMLVEADSKEEAIALAATVPAARLGGAVEVRPCEVYW
jgi:hypothetical protein